MRKYQAELDKIKPSEALLAETLRKVHEENRICREETERKRIEFHSVSPKFNWRVLAAAAACLCALATGIWVFQVSSAFVTDLSATAKPVSVSVAYRGRQDVTESESTTADFSQRCGIDFISLFTGYSLSESSVQLFADAQNTIIGDYGVLTYTDGGRKITLYASSTDQIAPDALLDGRSRQLSNTQVWFGKSNDGQILYAAWVQNGTALCAQGTGMRLSAFKSSIESALKS